MLQFTFVMHSIIKRGFTIDKTESNFKLTVFLRIYTFFVQS
jgi:hypothetical protein